MGWRTYGEGLSTCLHETLLKDMHSRAIDSVYAIHYDVHMTKTKRNILNTHTVVRHARFGNEQAASVTGGTLKCGQVVTLHPMCGDFKFIQKAIAQDAREQAAN